jgi:membrane AbrB-like protein
MSEELGADDRLVAFMQYLRVLAVVLLTPALAALAFSSGHGSRPELAGLPFGGSTTGWLLTLGVAAAGALLAERFRMPGGRLLGPMVLGAAVSVAVPGGFDAPPVLRELAFAVIGLQVGLRFTADTARQVGTLIVPVLAGILGMVLGCFGLAAAVAASTSIPLADAYLATTPGGLIAVAAVALDTGADVTFVVAEQTLRLVVMVAVAPLVVRFVARRMNVIATLDRKL